MTTDMDGGSFKLLGPNPRAGERITHALARLKRLKGWRAAFQKDVAASTRSAALINWAPVALGGGIILYFGLRTEPPTWTRDWAFASCALLGAFGFWLQRGQFPTWLWAAPAAFALALAMLGYGLSIHQTATRAAPVIAATDEPIAYEGWVEREEAGPRLRRIVLRTSWVEGYSGRDRPVRVQLAAPRGEGVSPGRYVRCFGNLSPPPGPVTPGGYDFARSAYFRQIGASGFAFGPCRPAAGPREQPPGASTQLWLAAMRRGTTDGILSATGGGSAAGFVAAIATGDQSAISPDDSKSMQSAGLTHLVAVSGMNMALVGGFAFFALRMALSVMGSLPLYVNVRAVAAASALITCAAYWALTGASASTTRAFVMAAIAFGAIILNRPALTLRGLAIAALAILIATPDAALAPGFQMSFAATLALVAAFEMERNRREESEEPKASRLTWIWRATAAAALTSLVAGLATGPYSTYHFQTYAKYGLFANIAATPLIAFVVTPALMVALPASVFGLQEWPLRVAEWGASQILNIADWAQGQSGAIGAVAQFSPIWLLLCTLGLCGLCMTKGLARATGGLLILAALIGAGLSPKPIVIVSADGAMVGALSDGFIRSSGKPEGFELQRLSQSIGAAPDAPTTILNETGLAIPGGRMAKLRGKIFLSLADKDAALADSCRAKEPLALIVQRGSKQACSQTLTLDRQELAQSGGVSIYLSKEGFKTETVRARRGERPWTKVPPQL